MKTRLLSLIVLLMCLLTLAHLTSAQDDNACSDTVANAYTLTEKSCQGLGNDQACYGNNSLLVTPAQNVLNLVFNQPGDMTPLQAIQTMRHSKLNAATGEWGISMLRLTAQTVETAVPADVDLVIFGNVTVENAGGVGGVAGEQFGPMEAFYFRSELGDRACDQAPDSGMLIQTPQGAGTVTLLINEVAIDFGSTVYLQAQPGVGMVVSVLEGEITITAFGKTVIVKAGMQSVIPLGQDGAAAGVPGDPEPYDENDFLFLPLILLPRSIGITPGGGVTITPLSTEEAIDPNAIQWYQVSVTSCVYLGGGLYQWYTGGVPLDGGESLPYTAGPFIGPYQPGCPPAPQQTEEAFDLTAGEGGIIIYDVYDCVYIGNADAREDLFRWYQAQVPVDMYGDQIGPHEYLAGPFTGRWRSGCPGIPTPQPSLGGVDEEYVEEDIEIRPSPIPTEDMEG